MAKRSRQTSMLANEPSAYGGDLLKTRAGRRGARPLSTRETMHLVLRSTKAKDDWSFRRPKNEAHVNRIIDRFSVIYGIRIVSMANVGNHLHLQIKLSNRFTYDPFIRAVTSAIAMAITGRNRWSRARERERTPVGNSAKKEKFWDCRPFTRVVKSFKAWLNLKDYVRINQLEGAGYRRSDARFMLKVERRFATEPDPFA